MRYRGVTYQSERARYQVKIKHAGRHIHLGHFQRPDVAARVWDVAAVLLRGPGTPLNFDGQPPKNISVGKIRQKLLDKGVLRP